MILGRAAISSIALQHYQPTWRACSKPEASTEIGHSDGRIASWISIVVVDDSKRSRDRVQLAHESPARYDAEFYGDRLIRAAESVCSPLGWRRDEIEMYLSASQEVSLTAFHD